MPIWPLRLPRSAVVELVTPQVATAAGRICLPGVGRDGRAGRADPGRQIGGGILARSALDATVAAVGAVAPDEADRAVPTARAASAADQEEADRAVRHEVGQL